MRHAHKIKLLMKRHQGGRGWTGQCIIPGNGGSAAVERSEADRGQCDLVADHGQDDHHGIDPLPVLQRIALGARTATKELAC